MCLCGHVSVCVRVIGLRYSYYFSLSLSVSSLLSVCCFPSDVERQHCYSCLVFFFALHPFCVDSSSYSPPPLLSPLHFPALSFNVRQHRRAERGKREEAKEEQQQKASVWSLPGINTSQREREMGVTTAGETHTRARRKPFFRFFASNVRTARHALAFLSAKASSFKGAQRSVALHVCVHAHWISTD